MTIQWLSDQTLLLQPPNDKPLKLIKWTVHPFSGVGYRNYLKSGKIELILKDVYTDTGSPIDEIKMILSSLPDIKNDTFALVKGGWAPLPYVIRNSHVISDRNFITELKSHFEGGELKNSTSTSDIQCLLADKCYHFNNIYFVFESNRKQIPDAETIRSQFLEGRKHILKAIPDAVFTYDEETELKNSLSLVQYCYEQMQLRMNFLLEISPIISKTVAKVKRREVWDQICEKRDNIGLEKNDIMVLCALAAASAGQSFNPGKRIIKPSLNYTKSDAYNAACDIQAIEILMNFQKKMPDMQHIFLTKDKNLMYFYSCICSYDMQNTSSGQINMNSEILPDLFIEFDEDKSHCNGDWDDLMYLKNIIN